MANYPEIAYWLALINAGPLKLNFTKPIIQQWCLTQKRPLAELFDLSPLELTTTFDLSDAQAGQVKAAVDNLEPQVALLNQWRVDQIEPIILTDPRYPKRLLRTLPPAHQPLIFWVQGAAHLLNQPGVTMLGQKDPDPITLKFIDEVIAALETAEIGLISGYGRGLDRVTFEMMLASQDGYAVTILPIGLKTMAKTTSKLEAAVQTGRVLLVSPFSPETPYQERLAEARNLLIDHLTLALLIPESDETSQNRAMAALNRGLPVFVKADTAGNRDLLNHGALLLTDPGEVIDWVQQAVLDMALQDDDEEEEDVSAAPLTATAPTEHPIADDDYALRGDDIPPLDSDEALAILSMGGEIPEILRKRLQKSQDNE
ncbi:MAG: DNA-processing protein DprA [Anaerolineaceae bacterium]|nr:DNA-processing protein DprA [Anaerolineaceae bacterium]MCB9098131.1 DNA-processing protein DprA [Anaerolineales bacterium]